MREDVRLLAHGQSLQRPLDGDETIAGLGRHLLGLVEHAGECRGHMRLGGAAARHFGQLGERGFGVLQRLLGIAAGAGDQAAGQPLGVVEQDLQQMFRGDLRVALADGNGLRRLEESLEAVGKLLEIHRSLVPLGGRDRRVVAGSGPL